MEQVSIVRELISLIGTGSGLLVFVVLWRLGIFKKNGNGNGHTSIEIDELKNQIATMQDNHLHTLTDKLDRFTEKMSEHNARELVLLEDIKNKLR